jgi:hypothetical protein
VCCVEGTSDQTLINVSTKEDDCLQDNETGADGVKSRQLENADEILSTMYL